MKKLFNQAILFTLIGILCFAIDFSLYMLCIFCGISYLLAGIIGFVVSIIVNYYLNMKYVFIKRDDISERQAILIYFSLSVIGLGLNELVLYAYINIIYISINIHFMINNRDAAEVSAKIFATAVVTIYNFISRKFFLEKHHG